jgi:2'-5' RNA ligase superfamily
MRMLAEVMILPSGVWAKTLDEEMLELNSEFDTSYAMNLPPHVVVKDLGEICRDDFKEAMCMLGEVASQTQGFDVAMGRSKFFSRGRGRGIYASVENTVALSNLHKNLVKSMKRFSKSDSGGYELSKFDPVVMFVGPDLAGVYLDIAKKKYGNKDFAFNFPAKSVSIVLHPDYRECNSPFRIQMTYSLNEKSAKPCAPTR